MRPTVPSKKGREPVLPEPVGFRVRRDLPLGRHPIEAAFPGLGSLPTAGRLEPDPAERARLFRETEVELVAEDFWMYVAPHEQPELARRRKFTLVVEPKRDCIVIGEAHLRESPMLTLFLDIYHELGHVRQRRAGQELFDRPESYVERPTEVEAYRFVIEEARAIGVPNDVLRDYLKVEWISRSDHKKLLATLGVPVKG